MAGHQSSRRWHVFDLWSWKLCSLKRSCKCDFIADKLFFWLFCLSCSLPWLHHTVLLHPLTQLWQSLWQKLRLVDVVQDAVGVKVCLFCVRSPAQACTHHCDSIGIDSHHCKSQSNRLASTSVPNGWTEWALRHHCFHCCSSWPEGIETGLKISSAKWQQYKQQEMNKVVLQSSK